MCVRSPARSRLPETPAARASAAVNTFQRRESGRGRRRRGMRGACRGGEPVPPVIHIASADGAACLVTSSDWPSPHFPSQPSPTSPAVSGIACRRQGRPPRPRAGASRRVPSPRPRTASPRRGPPPRSLDADPHRGPSMRTPAAFPRRGLAPRSPAATDPPDRPSLSPRRRPCRAREGRRRRRGLRCRARGARDVAECRFGAVFEHQATSHRVRVRVSGVRGSGPGSQGSGLVAGPRLTGPPGFGSPGTGSRGTGSREPGTGPGAGTSVPRHARGDVVPVTPRKGPDLGARLECRGPWGPYQGFRRLSAARGRRRRSPRHRLGPAQRSASPAPEPPGSDLRRCEERGCRRPRRDPLGPGTTSAASARPAASRPTRSTSHDPHRPRQSKEPAHEPGRPEIRRILRR
jgi:hypothetical protein